ncbi:hypothetical protein MRX96_016272 [Rhipicephalus microplus]
MDKQRRHEARLRGGPQFSFATETHRRVRPPPKLEIASQQSGLVTPAAASPGEIPEAPNRRVPRVFNSIRRHA